MSIEEKKDDGKLRFLLPKRMSKVQQSPNTPRRSIPRSPASLITKFIASTVSIEGETPKAQNSTHRIFFADGDSSNDIYLQSNDKIIKETISSVGFPQKSTSISATATKSNTLVSVEKCSSEKHARPATGLDTLWCEGLTPDRHRQGEEMYEVVESIESDEGPVDTDEAIEEMKGSSESKETEAMKKAKKHLNMSAAARMNANAVAYLHSLNGEPSPRHFWKNTADIDVEASPARSSINSVDDADNYVFAEEHKVTPMNILARKSLYERIQFKKKMSSGSFRSDESLSPKLLSPKAAESKINGAKSYKSFRFGEEYVVEVGCETEVATSISSSVLMDGARLFSAYNPKFKGRKPIPASKKTYVPSPRMETDFKFVTGLPKHHQLPSPCHKPERKITVTVTAFKRGVEILRQNREYDIEAGIDQRVVAGKKQKNPKVQSYFRSHEYMEPKDPIHRAGRRLLSKAAVPIQAGARRFLAQREAVDRMWGLLEIQSYFRRWKAEAALLAYSRSAILIQKVFRGYRLRKAIHLRTNAAVTIQKIVRGYLIAAMTYDLVYRIILVQAQVRRFVSTMRTRRKLLERKTCIENEASIKIETWWRCRSVRTQYQYLLVDTILLQSLIRRWNSKRLVDFMTTERRICAAVIIQKIWRGFQGYTDYIFGVVDIVVCQRTARAWLARKQVHVLRVMRSILIIQCQWRRYVASKKYIFSLVYIMIIQRNVRGWIGRQRTETLRRTYSSIKIQSAWRRAVAYEFKNRCLNSICLIQRASRSLLAKKVFNQRKMEHAAVILQKQWRCYCAQMRVLHDLVHIIMVQSVVRRFLANLTAERRRTRAKLI